MVWLIGVLLLALGGGVAVVTRWGGRRPVADDTLVAELLGPPPARPPRAGAPVREDAAPPPVPAAEPLRAGGWLDTQLAWITDWSQQMHEQIASEAAGPETGGDRNTPPGAFARRDSGPPVAGLMAGAGRRAGASHESPGPARVQATPRRCIATTVKGNRCKLPAEPADMRCAIHAKRAHP